jgi:hypothetical protein
MHLQVRREAEAIRREIAEVAESAEGRARLAASKAAAEVERRVSERVDEALDELRRCACAPWAVGPLLRKPFVLSVRWHSQCMCVCHPCSTSDRTIRALEGRVRSAEAAAAEATRRAEEAERAALQVHEKTRAVMEGVRASPVCCGVLGSS